MLCDGTNLFIGATFHEAEMKKLKASPANDPFWNDCIEVYFDPRHDGTRSIQLVIDCIGRKMWEKRYDEGYGWWVDNAWHMLADWEGRSALGAKAWTVEIRLNCVSFGIDPTPGSVCGFNPCRFRLGAGDEFSAWAFEGQRRQKSMPDWGHLLFAAAGEQAHGREVSRTDVERLYGRLDGRCVEVPVSGGFRVLTAEGEKRATFAEQLAPLLARCEELAAAARRHSLESTTRLGEEHEFLRGLNGTVEQTEALLEKARGTTLTMGAFDRLVDALQDAADRLDGATWQTRVAALVAEVQHRKEKP